MRDEKAAVRIAVDLSDVVVFFDKRAELRSEDGLDFLNEPALFFRPSVELAGLSVDRAALPVGGDRGCRAFCWSVGGSRRHDFENGDLCGEALDPLRVEPLLATFADIAISPGSHARHRRRFRLPRYRRLVTVVGVPSSLPESMAHEHPCPRQRPSPPGVA